MVNAPEPVPEEGVTLKNGCNDVAVQATPLPTDNPTDCGGVTASSVVPLIVTQRCRLLIDNLPASSLMLVPVAMDREIAATFGFDSVIVNVLSISVRVLPMNVTVCTFCVSRGL